MKTLLTYGLSYPAMMAAAGEGKPGGATTVKVETSSVGTTGGHIQMGVPGEDAEVKEGSETGKQSVEVGGNPDTVDGDQKVEGDGEADDEEADKEAADAKDEDTEADDKSLPDFKADDAGVVKAYEGQYKKDGMLDLSTLSTEWWSNRTSAGEGEPGHLNPGTYEYLKSLGIPEGMVKEVEAGQQALVSQSVNALYDRAGGKVNLETALKWATDKDAPAYTTEQRTAFNEAMDKGGVAANEAVDLLMSRHEKADRSRVNPRKTTTEAAGGPGSKSGSGKVFADKEEWLAARKEARGNIRKLSEISKVFRRSPGAKDW